MEMGTQGAGRKRLPNRERLTAEDDALNQIAREAEARLAAKRAARAEAREIRMKELERQQKEASDEDERMSVGSRGSLRVEERPEKDFEKGTRAVSNLSAATLASLGGTSSRRGSGDTSISVDTEASIREIKDSLAEVEEKYKKAMVSNAQLDNEKTNFMYQVDTLKDALLELEEQLAESRRQYEEKSKEFEREKHAHSILQFQFMEIKETLQQREEMLVKHGIIPNLEVATNGETSDGLNSNELSDSSKVIQGTTPVLKPAGDGTLGRANEVEMKNEILENVGKKEILQNTEREEHKEETEEKEIVKTLHADENTEAEKTIEDNFASTLMLNSGHKEQIQIPTEHVSGNVASLENSDTVELKKEKEASGDSIEAQESVSKEAGHGGMLSERNNQGTGTVYSLDIDINLENPNDLERLAQEQEKVTDSTFNENQDDGEIFHEALDFVESSHTSTEPAEIAREDMVTEEPNIEVNVERPCEEVGTENKVVGRLERQLDEDEGDTGRTTDKIVCNKNEDDGTKEEIYLQNVDQRQEIKVLGSPVDEEGVACETEITPDEIIKKEKLVEIQESSSIFPGHDIALAEEEQTVQDEGENGKDNNTERVPTKGIEQEEAFTCMLDIDADSEMKEEKDKIFTDEPSGLKEGTSEPADQDQGNMEEIHFLETILDRTCCDHKAQEEGNAEISDKMRESKEGLFELMDDTNTHVEIQTTQGSEGIKLNQAQERSMTIGDVMQSGVEQEPSPDGKGESVENRKGLGLPDQENDSFISDGGENDSLQKATETSDQLSEACEENTKEIKVQGAELNDECQLIRQEHDKNEKGKGNEEDKSIRMKQQDEMQEVKKEEVVPNIKEEFDCLKTQKTESDKLSEQVEMENQEKEMMVDSHKTFQYDDELRQNLETNGRHDAQDAMQILQESKDKEVVTETNKTGKGEKENMNQCKTDKEANEGTLSKGDGSVEQEKEKESEEVGHLQTDTSASETAKKPCERENKKSEKMLDIDLEKTTDESEQLGSADNSRDENKEDTQIGRRSKGKSKEDCIIS